jgi:Zn-dependent protease
MDQNMLQKILENIFQYIDLVYLPVLILSLMLHEIAHGFASYKLGDLTAKNDGRLSLNPLRHIDPIGFILMLVYHFGWAKPVMINPYNLNNPKKDMAVISLAGPMTNLLLSILFFIPLLMLQAANAFDGIPEYLALFIEQGFTLNVSLAVFNMLPIPPLDGSKVFGSFLPDHLYYKVVHSNPRIGMGILLLLSFTGYLSKVIRPIISAAIYFYYFIGLLIAGLFKSL